MAQNMHRPHKEIIRVLVADDHAILRAGLKEILVRDLAGVVCDEAENAQQALAKVQSQPWDRYALHNYLVD
jgi:two-component system, NarL family, invasion response regulator UvrY